VLAGWVPPLPKAAVGASLRPLSALSTITLEVNPRLAPKEVAALYNKARRRFVGGRDRAMLPKHLALAVFVEASGADARPWVEVRNEWNRLHPKWRFDPEEDPQARRFALEARTAWTRVTGARWQGHAGHRRGSHASPKGSGR